MLKPPRADVLKHAATEDGPARAQRPTGRLSVALSDEQCGWNKPATREYLQHLIEFFTILPESHKAIAPVSHLLAYILLAQAGVSSMVSGSMSM